MARFTFVVAAALLAAWPAAGQGSYPEVLQTEYQPLTVSRVVSGLEHPWSIAFLPDGDLLVTERPGRLQRVSNGVLAEVSGVPAVYPRMQGGLLDVALHPGFEENGWVYLAYSAGGPDSTVLAVGRGRLEGTRLEGFEELFRSNRAASPGGHYGSRILFLGDGTFLVSVGDRGAEPARAQDTRDHAGSVLRLTDDGGIPRDNPFIGSADHAPELYTYGHRNIQGLTRDPVTGEIWATEHGPRGGDELNLLEAGRNYGWPLVSLGRHYPNQQAWGQARSLSGMEDPIIEFLPTLAPSGLAYVEGSGHHPAWRGSLLAGGLRSERVLRLVIENRVVVHMEEIVNGQLGRVRDVRHGPDGAIYVATDAPDGAVFSLTPPARDETRLLARMGAAGSLDRWLGLIRTAGLIQPFEGQGPFTLFAPTDDALGALPDSLLEELATDPQRLMALIARHVVAGSLTRSDLERAERATSVSGIALPIRLDQDDLWVDGARIVRSDIEASNGVIHAIDRVLDMEGDR